jgi:hypothetical protein
MQWRAHVTSIGLMVAAAGALAYAYLDRGSVSEAEKKTREGSVFVAWRREDLARIVVDHGGEHLVLERAKDDAGDAEWWMRAPLQERADSEASDKLASAFELAAVVRKVAGDVQVPGLDPPRATGEIGMGRMTYHFALGGDAPTPAGAAYLRVDGGGVVGGGTVVVARELVTALLEGTDRYRSRFFVPYVSVQLAKLEVKRGTDADLLLERADDVSFKLLPSGLRASRGKLDAVWSALGQMRAEAFVSEAVAAPLVATPQATITMTPIAAGTAPGAIRVGGVCPGNPDDVVVVRDAPTRLTACAPKGILPGLATTEAELVDPHLFAAHDDEIAELRLESVPPGGPSLELARKESGWRQKAPVERDLPPEEAAAATTLVRAIARAEGAAPHKSDEPFEPKWRVTVQRGDGGAGGVAEVVEVGSPDAAGDVVVRRAFDGARLRVAAAVARKLVPRGIALHGPEVWSPSIEGALISSIETHCEGVDQTVVREPSADAWTLRAPAGFATDNSSVLALVDAVTRMRAESWVADANDGHFGFAAEACAVALTLRGDAGTRVVRVEVGGSARASETSGANEANEANGANEANEASVYARTSESPAVFVASAAVRDVARAWLVDLHGFSPANVEAVTLVRNGKRAAFGVDAGQDEASEAVLSAANVLRADAVVHLGATRAEEGFSAPSLILALRGRAAGEAGERDAGGAATRRVIFGAELPGGKSRYARLEGVDAVFAVDEGRTRAFFDRF